MSFCYQVYGLNCLSEVEIPAFLSVSNLLPTEIDFQVKIGKVERQFTELAQILDDYSQLNEREFYLHVPEVGRYFVRNGNEVTIEPLAEAFKDVLLYFQSNCLAAILFQRNLIPFHVSGVMDKEGGVWLFSAPSGTGKSTTALKLQEMGYRLFTDDTALVYVENGVCYARASYPMLKAWQQTMDNQKFYSIQETFQIETGYDKFGVLFHRDFVNLPAPVKGIVFLDIAGDQIRISPMKAPQGMAYLMANVYRGEWASALNKIKLQFLTAAEIAKTVPFFEASRPEDFPTFKDFAMEIEKKIILGEMETLKIANSI
ncbi:hypothetical protein EF405_20250 [Cyclobacteriaceae bacterium YHN15]|nr:hypothetical protein EF405_20250 [Cyclobacteriaceae bacterium YHN15]